MLEKNKDGFFLMLEAGLVDKYSHPLDWTRSVGDTIAFDKVVERAKAYCAKNPDTLLIVTGDHTHSISVAGTVDDNKPGKDMREKVGVYADAGYPNYEDKDKDGFPTTSSPPSVLPSSSVPTPTTTKRTAPILTPPSTRPSRTKRANTSPTPGTRTSRAATSSRATSRETKARACTRSTIWS